LEGQEKGQGLKLNGMHHTLVYKYTENINLLGDNITTVMNNTEGLSLASKETALEVNAEKPSCHQKEGKNIHNKDGKYIISKHGKPKKESKF